MDGASEQMTQILEAVDAGDESAADKLLPLVYDELRRLAAARMAREAPGQTLQPTALVHEAWLQLVGSGHQHRRLGKAIVGSVRTSNTAACWLLFGTQQEGSGTGLNGLLPTSQRFNVIGKVARLR
jgi:hypothetical protein